MCKEKVDRVKSILPQHQRGFRVGRKAFLIFPARPIVLCPVHTISRLLQNHRNQFDAGLILFSIMSKKQRNLHVLIPSNKSALTEPRISGHLQATRSKSENSSSSFSVVFPSWFVSEANTSDLRICLPGFDFIMFVIRVWLWRILTWAVFEGLGQDNDGEPQPPLWARPTFIILARVFFTWDPTFPNPPSNSQWLFCTRGRRRTGGRTWRCYLSRLSSTGRRCSFMVNIRNRLVPIKRVINLATCLSTSGRNSSINREHFSWRPGP